MFLIIIAVLLCCFFLVIGKTAYRLLYYFLWEQFRHRQLFKQFPKAGSFALFELFQVGAYDSLLESLPKLSTTPNQTFPPIINLGTSTGTHFIGVCSADGLRTVLRETEAIIKHPEMYSVLGEAIGHNGLVMSSGEMWHTQRQRLSPMFHLKRLRAFLPLINEEAELLCQRLLDLGNAGRESLDPTPIFGRTALTVICRAAFSNRLDIQEVGDCYTNVVECMETYAGFSLLLPKIFLRFGFPAVSRFQKATAKLDEILLATLAKARAEEAQLESDDFIGQMAYLRDENGEYAIDETLIRDECKAFLFAAMDTTSHTLAWLMYFLGKHPDLQDRIVEEYDRVLGGDPVTEETLKQLKFTEACFIETLRFRPPIPSLDRLTTREIEICGHKIPAGTYVAGLLICPHYAEEHFENPKEFNRNTKAECNNNSTVYFVADRWLDDSLKTRHAFCYLPFSGGSRNCMGQKLAKQEATILLAKLCKTFRFDIGDSGDVKMAFKGTVAPHGLKVKFIPREEE